MPEERAAEARAAGRLFERGQAQWPQIVLERGAFEGYLADHAAQGAFPAESYAADVYLACACACGVDGALEAFERTFAGDLARAVASIDPSRVFVEEVVQQVRERLFVVKGREPGKIADYAGRASLRSWLWAVGVRSAISVRRRRDERKRTSFDDDSDLRLLGVGPEFEYLRKRYKRSFEEAVRVAVRALAPRDRLLLRLNVVDGLSIDRLGAVYAVGRSTAARWLANAREALLEHAHRELRTSLSLTSTELDSIAAELRSQLEVSLRTLLAPSATARD